MDPIKIWATNRKNTIKELKRLEESIRYHASNTKIASVVGNGTCIISGIGAAACYAFAPLTGGLSLAPALILTAAGASTTIGATVANHFIEKSQMKAVQLALDNDRASLDALKKLITKANEVAAAEGIRYAGTAGKGIPSGINHGSKIAAKIASKLSVPERVATSLLKIGTTARFVAHAATVIALPMDIFFFVKDTIELANGNVSASADAVGKLAKELQDEYDEIMSE